jgi:hypothetical protein
MKQVNNKGNDTTGKPDVKYEIEWVDLQDQVRAHIKADRLFDWHEAMTNEAMTYLENLLLTFAPMFYPGSVGFAKTVQPYLKQPVGVQPCETCHGEGSIEKNIQRDGYPERDVPVVCSDCNGSGQQTPGEAEAKAKAHLEGMYASNKEGWQKAEQYEKEIVRLKGLIDVCRTALEEILNKETDPMVAAGGALLALNHKEPDEKTRAWAMEVIAKHKKLNP